MSEQPNILILLPDQMRADFVGCYGADWIATPHIDALAACGTTFEQAIAPFPICVPCRAAMLTGQTAVETGVIDNHKWLRPDRREMGVETWPELLGAAGYHTASIGKTHFYPWDLQEGFAERIISEDKRHIWVQDDYADALAAAGLKKLHGHELPGGYAETKGAALSGLPDPFQADAWVADQAIDFLRRQPEGRPFAAFVGFPSPHCPYDPTPEALARVHPAHIPPPLEPTRDSASLRHWMVENYRQAWADLDYADLTRDQVDAIRHHYAALIEMVDEQIGRIVEAVRALPQGRNTVIIFASDHGDFVGDYEMVGKTLFYEPSIHVPLILADLREEAGPRRVAAPVALPDIFETMLDLAGLASPRRGPFRTLRAAPDHNRMIFGLSPHGMMVRSNDFKLTRYDNGIAEAYDLVADPTERHNLYHDPAERDRIDTHDRYLTAELMRGMTSANADKDVRAAKAADPDGFARRGWDRPYPARVE